MSTSNNLKVNEQQLRAFGALIGRLASGEHLTRKESFDAYKAIILNEQPELQQGAFLATHLMKGPSIEELSGAWDALHEFDTSKINAVKREGKPVCDIVGTGSDSLKTVNCSSPASIIASAAGLRVAKKGARKVTGVSGASDVFELLGVNISLPLERAEVALNEIGLCYLPGEAFLKSGWARLIQSMRFTSAFNILGPLTMPCAQTEYIVLGTFSENVCRQSVQILKEVGIKGAIAPFGLCSGMDRTLGMDEFSPCGATCVVELRNGKINEYEVTPFDFGIKECSLEAIASAESSVENVKRIENVFTGEYETSLADFFCMNAGAALYCAGMARDYKEGTSMARNALVSGAAYQKLLDLKQIMK